MSKPKTAPLKIRQRINQIYQSANLEESFAGFFGELASLNSGEVSEFLSALSRRSDANFSPTYLQQLQSKM